MTRPVLSPLSGVGIIDTAAITDDAVTQAKIANNAIGTNELINAAVTDAKLAANIKIANAWAGLSLNAGWTGYFLWKIVGNLLFLNADLVMSASPSTLTIGTLPVGARPVAQAFAIPARITNSATKITVNTNGDVVSLPPSFGGAADVTFSGFVPFI